MRTRPREGKRRRSLPELYFHLHECHSLGNDRQRQIILSKKASDIVHGYVIDTIDLNRYPVNSIGCDDFAFVRVYPLEHEVQFLEKRFIPGLWFNPCDRFTRQPAAFVSR